MTCTHVLSQECAEVKIIDENLNENFFLNCNNNLEQTCLDLTAEYTQIPTTDNYELNPIPFDSNIPFNQGIALTPDIISIDENNVDDRFSPVINIGFPFCFYNNIYSQLVIGSNGIVSFNLSNANAICPAGISSTNPNPALVTNSIFGIQTDMIFSLEDESEIYYETTGIAPCRKFVINYYRAKLFGCEETTTFQLVLHETSNIIELFIEDKPESCLANQSSLIGILNDFGDNGISPANRNTSVWSTSNEAWSFSPSGNIPASVSWLDNDGNIIGYGDNIQICPTENTTYSVNVEYASCLEYDSVFSDSASVTFDPFFPLIDNTEVYVCDVGTDNQEFITLSNYNDWVLYTPANNFNITYYESQNDALNQVNPITNHNLTEQVSFYIRTQSQNNPQCFKIQEITFIFASTFLGEIDFALCDNNNDGVEESLNVQSVLTEILSEYDLTNFQVFTSLNNAQNAINSVSQLDIYPETDLWLNIPFNEECSVVYGPFNFNFISAPNLESIPTISYFGCDIDSNNSESFDWENAVSELISVPEGIQVQAFITEENAINQIQSLSQIRDSYSTVYIRATNSNGCYNVYPVNVEVDFSGMSVRNSQDRICFDGTEDVTINLENYYEAMIDEYDGDFTYEFFNTSSNAENNVNPIANLQTISQDGSLFFYDYYVRFQTNEECYSVKRLRIYLIHPEPLTSQIPVCDYGDNNTENVVLSNYQNSLTGNVASTLTYYNSIEDAQNNVNAITDFVLTSDQTLYVRINQFGCEDIYPIDFYLTAVQDTNTTITIDLEESCNGTTNQQVNLTSYYNEIYSENLTPEFTFYGAYNQDEGTLYNVIENPQNFTFEDNQTIYVLLDFNGETCNIIKTLNLQINPFVPLALVEANLYACDFEQDLNETFDLTQSIPQLVSNLPSFNDELYEITFYNHLEDAENGINPVSETFIPNQFVYAIYVRFQNISSGCYSIENLHLNTLESPKIFEGNYTACDTDFNGMYNIVLEDLIPVVNLIGSDLSFDFYLTEQDAIDQINAITGVYENSVLPDDIWVRSENIDDCYDIKNVNLFAGEVLEISQTEFNLEACDFNRDGFDTFDLSQVITQLNLTNETFEFYITQNDIVNQNPISDYENYTNTQSGGETIYLKVSNGDLCPAFATIDLILNTPPQVNIQDVEFCENQEVQLIPEIIDTSQNYTYEWRNADDEIIANTLELQGTIPEGIYTFNIIPENSPNCFGTYPVEITINELQVSELGFSLNLCDTNGNGIQQFDLTQIISQLNPNQSVLSYHLGNDFEISITNPETFENTIAYNQTVFALIQDDANCPLFYPIVLDVGQFQTGNQVFDLNLCDTNGNGIQSFDLTQINTELNPDQSITGFYEANNLSSEITNPTTFSNTTAYNQSVYVLIEGSSDCPEFYEIQLQVESLTTLNQTETLIQCNENGNGLTTFNLNEAQVNPNQTITAFFLEQNIQTQITNPNTFNNTTPYSQTIYALINDGNGCDKIMPIELEVLVDPQITIDETRICPDGNTEIFPEIANPNSHYQFEWVFNETTISNNLNSGLITQSGSYTLLVTTDIDTDCLYTFNVTVNELESPEILELIVNETTVQVIANGIYPMEYAIDNANWQISNIFNNVLPGAHQFFVRYRDLGCISNPSGTYITEMYNVITPNGDGLNDTLHFTNLGVYNGEKVSVRIFNRNGRLVFEAESDTEIIWNGTRAGSPIPTGDYWYIIQFPDKEKLTGHITVKNK